MKIETQNAKLSALIERGGIFYDIKGNSCREIMTNVVNLISDELFTHDKDALLRAVMEREALISTGIENGIALPHPRTPLLDECDDPFVTIAFPAAPPADWETPDNSKVRAIFLIVSKSPKQHIDVMSKISFLCQQDKFYKLVITQALKEEIMEALEAIEDQW
ncbi:MAG: PTS sugar transporter subunit IIA [Treponema sp.]|nr:PTS sugar transporter subunit IIA [Treponema sp.]MCL2237750.1 PTS sugar transporter subunit IIA [Treponema sp.]